MALLAIFLVLGLSAGILAAPSKRDVENKIDLLMPQVQPKQPDTYLCHGMQMKGVNTYITGFIPIANKNIAHHMLLYGCIAPGTSDDKWNCGEMAKSDNPDSTLKTAGTCGSGSKILYAWAMDAPSLTLPKDVGFEVGGSTDIKYLVLQVHYKNVSSFLPPENKTDSSGLTLITTTTPMPRRAGVYLLGTGGMIPADSNVYMETACKFPDDELEIHPFAYRTHAHTHGRVISGYVVRDGVWTEIGRMDPRKPEMFYNATTPGLVIKKGDILAARCTMENKDNPNPVTIGSTQNDEMCNFYVMYYVDGDRILKQNYCFTSGPPFWSWENFRAKDFNPKDVPADASVIPDSNRKIEQTINVQDEEDVEARDEGDLDVALDSLSRRQLEDLMNVLTEDEYYYNSNDNGFD